MMLCRWRPQPCVNGRVRRPVAGTRGVLTVLGFAFRVGEHDRRLCASGIDGPVNS